MRQCDTTTPADGARIVTFLELTRTRGSVHMVCASRSAGAGDSLPCRRGLLVKYAEEHAQAIATCGVEHDPCTCDRGGDRLATCASVNASTCRSRHWARWHCAGHCSVGCHPSAPVRARALRSSLAADTQEKEQPRGEDAFLRDVPSEVIEYGRQALGLSTELVRRLLANATTIHAPLAEVGNDTIGLTSTDAVEFRISSYDLPQKHSGDLQFTPKTSLLPAWKHQYRLSELGHGSVVVDIGANVGVVPTVLDRLLMQQQLTLGCAAARPHTVISVEPVPENALLLRWNLAAIAQRPSPCGQHIRSVALHRALTRDSRDVTVAIGSRSMSAHMVEHDHPRLRGEPRARSYAVRSTSLEQILEDQNVHRVDLLKLGAPFLIERVRKSARTRALQCM